MEKKVTRSGVVFGKRNVAELIKKLLDTNTPSSKWPFREVLVKKNPSYDIAEDILSLLPDSIKVTYKPQNELDAYLQGANHQGIILIKDSNSSKKHGDLGDLKETLTEPSGPILILDRIQDTGNLGNILRTAECFGFDKIVMSDRESAPINETVERISSGALHHLSIFRVTNLSQALEHLKEIGYWIVATSDRGEEDWSKMPNPEECAVIMGNEEAGVKRILLENADFIFRIPLHGSVSSLNVTVATGITLDRIINSKKR